MHRLLEPQDFRKLNILSELSLTQEPINMNELAKKLDLNIKTLLATVDEINQDAELYKQDIMIERYSRSELKLEVASNFSIFYFKLRYLKESLLYQVLHSIFNNEYQSMPLLADNYHISVTSLYRKISRVKDVLSAFDLEFDASYKFPINGSEKQIRYFFFQFYWYSAQMFEWPFPTELKRLCLRLHDEIFIDQFKTKSLVMKEKIILWLAINIIRLQAGYTLSSEDVEEMKQFSSSNIKYLNLKKHLDKHLANISYKGTISFGEDDYILFYCMLICDEDYFNDDELAFLTISGKERKIFEEASLVFLNKCDTYLNRTLSNTEYYSLFINLLRVNMHACFFIQKGLFMSLHQRFDYIKDSYIDYLPAFDEFYENLYEGDERFQILRDNPNLYQRYLILLVNNLDKKTFYPEIKVALFILESKNIENFYRKKIQSLTQSPVHFVDEIIEIEDIDLVISYIPLDLGENLNYFIINIPATSWDWDRLESKLSEIQNDKRLTQNLILNKL